MCNTRITVYKKYPPELMIAFVPGEPDSDMMMALVFQVNNTTCD